MKYYNEIVPFKVAKKLKEAGFPQAETLSLYKSSGLFLFPSPVCKVEAYKPVKDRFLYKCFRLHEFLLPAEYLLFHLEKTLIAFFQSRL